MKPVQKVELPEKRTGFRVAALIICIVIALASVAYGVSNFVGKKEGWVKIIPEATDEKHFANDLVFEYEFGKQGKSPAAEYRQLSSRYTELSVRAYKVFSSSEEFASSNNVYYLNRHVNEDVLVDPVLYDALALLKKYNCDLIYLGPVYEQYAGLFSCTEDYEASDFDPAYNNDIADYFKELLGYVNDRNAVSIEFSDDKHIRLNVSDAYLSFAEREGVKNFIDFFWLQNAFAVDYIADKLIADGYTHGVITSFDGFSRNLGEVGIPLASNIFDRMSKSKNAVARMEHKIPINTVYLRDYARTEQDGFHYYKYANGETRASYIDINDGRSKAAVSDFVAYSSEYGCAEIALRIADIYIKDEFDPSAAETLKNRGVNCVYCIDRVIYYSGADSVSLSLYPDNPLNYTLQPIN